MRKVRLEMHNKLIVMTCAKTGTHLYCPFETVDNAVGCGPWCPHWNIVYIDENDTRFTIFQPGEYYVALGCEGGETYLKIIKGIELWKDGHEDV